MSKLSATKKLYLEDSYRVSFQAGLISCSRLADGRYAAVLDQTCFYPESGGQLADRGVIEEVEVTDVWEDEGETVYHGLTEELRVGPVRCEVDWEHRLDHMQQHTGQHILSRAFIEVGALETISFHMGDESCTIDLAGGDLTPEILQRAEMLSNAIVSENRDVLVKSVAPAELEETELRKKLPEGVSEVRLVEVADFDVIGCCGTHVRTTGELGIIKVLKSEKAKGANRVSFKTGKRAFRDYRDKHEIVKLLANQFTTSTAGVVDTVNKIQADGQRYRKELQKLSKRLAAFEAQALVDSAQEHDNQKLIVRVFSDCDESYLRALASELKRKTDTVRLIGSEGGTVICNACADTKIDFSETVIERARSLGGRGGGKGAFATVQLPKEVDVADFLERVADEIKRGRSTK
jgi:alanyl-tRNA synthetase